MHPAILSGMARTGKVARSVPLGGPRHPLSEIWNPPHYALRS
jgi:hypothetical protein